MRLKITKSKNAESWYIIKSTYENGKHSSKVVEKLGTLEEVTVKAGSMDPVIWANEYIKRLTEAEKENSRKIMVPFIQGNQIQLNSTNIFNGGYLFLQKIYSELGLPKICSDISRKYKFEYDLNSVLSRLVYGRILSPSSKLSTMEYSKTLLEQPDFDLQHIYRGLEVIAKESDSIQSELYKNCSSIAKRNDKVLYYDCTNYYFELEEADGLKQYGYSKENRPNPIVEMGLFMDGDGIPLAFCIHPGNTNEQVTMKPLEQNIIRDFGHSEFVVCTDAGLSSYANRKFNSIMNRKFITVQSLKTMKDVQKEWALNTSGWKIPGDSRIYTLEYVKENPDLFKDAVLYKEQWIKENNLEQRFIVTFSLKYMEYTRNLRERHIQRAIKVLENPSTLEVKRPTDYKRFIGQLEFDDNGTVVENRAYILNEQRIEDESRYDGFYAVATNLDDDAEEIVRINSRRWQIEECFRIMKSEFKARPVYLSREDRIKAHFLTCFLAMVIYRYVEKRLNNSFTCQQILKTLKDMNFMYVSGDGYIPAYTRTDITDAIHDSFGFRTDYEIISKASMKKIFKFTKS